MQTGEILDKTTVDTEQETAGVLKALIAIQAPEPGVQYIPLERQRKVVEYIQLAFESATQGQKMHQNSEVTTSSIIGISHNDLSR